MSDLFTKKRQIIAETFFSRNSVKNILSIIVNFVRDIFARFPRAWSSRISLNANQFSINCLCKGNYFQKIMIEKLVYQKFVNRVIKSARISQNTCMHGYHAMNYRKWMHLILHNFKVSLQSFRRVCVKLFWVQCSENPPEKRFENE